MAYVYSKEQIAKRNKPWQKDEVMEEVVKKLKAGTKAKTKGVEGKVLKATAMNTNVFIPSKRYKGKSNSQKLAETLEIPDKLPELPENLRTFAFRYATEPRRNMDWANIFHVSIYTIRNWLLKPPVVQYYLKVRQERQALMIERLTELEKKAYAKLYEILEQPVTTDNAEVVRKTALDVLSLKASGKVPRDNSGTTIIVNQEQQQIALSKAEADLSIDQLKELIDEYEDIDRIVDEG